MYYKGVQTCNKFIVSVTDLIVRMMKMLGNEEKKEDYLTMECEAKNGIEIIRKIVNMTKKSVSQTAED